MTYAYPKTIKEAAELLDTAYNGWHTKIDVAKLRMTYNYNCILGQLYGTWEKGLERLFGMGYRDNDGVFGSLSNVDSWKQEINERLNNKPKLITFLEAMTTLYAGKKVKHKSWFGYIYLKDDQLYDNEHNLYNPLLSSTMKRWPDNWLIVDTITIESLKPGEQFTVKGDEVVYTRTTEPDRQLYDGCKLKVMSQYLEVTKVS
jgi:hypothetical protein